MFNAANEVCVDAFHEGALGFVEIVDTVARVVDRYQPASGEITRESLAETERWARAEAARIIAV